MRTDIDVICDRLLDSEEHAVESAIPQVAEDAVDLIRGLEADALDRVSAGLEDARQQLEAK